MVPPFLPPPAVPFGDLRQVDWTRAYSACQLQPGWPPPVAPGLPVALNILLAMASTPTAPPPRTHRTIAPLVGPDDERVFTDSGIEIEPPLRRGRRRPRPRGAARRARRAALHPRHPRADVPRPALDDAPVRRLRLARGHQRALPLPDRARLDRALDGLRPADPARPRLRRPALPRRGRPHRRPDRHDRGHADLLRPDPARQRLDLDDDQRAGRDPAAALRAGRRGTGRPLREAARHGPERRAEGVHGARQLHLPAGADDAADHRHLRVLPRERAEMEHDLDLRVPHPREGLLGRAGGRLHALQRDRLRRGGARAGPEDRRVRAAPRLLLQLPQQRLPGDRQVPRGAADVGEDRQRAVRGARTRTR